VFVDLVYAGRTFRNLAEIPHAAPTISKANNTLGRHDHDGTESAFERFAQRVRSAPARSKGSVVGRQRFEASLPVALTAPAYSQTRIGSLSETLRLGAAPLPPRMTSGATI
jgi:hypothetical protein